MRSYDAAGASTAVLQLPRGFGWVCAALDVEHVAAVGQAELRVLEVARRGRLDQPCHATEALVGTERVHSEHGAAPAIAKLVKKSKLETDDGRREGRRRKQRE